MSKLRFDLIKVLPCLHHLGNSQAITMIREPTLVTSSQQPINECQEKHSFKENSRRTLNSSKHSHISKSKWWALSRKMVSNKHMMKIWWAINILIKMISLLIVPNKMVISNPFFTSIINTCPQRESPKRWSEIMSRTTSRHTIPHKAQ